MFVKQMPITIHERTGETVKTHFASLPEKETVFGIQRKRGSQAGQVVPNRVSAARLYAPAQHRHRPWPPPLEQGKPVVLSHLFSPPAPVGVGARRRLFYLFTLPHYLFPFIRRDRYGPAFL